MKILICTNNQAKSQEFKSMLKPFECLSAGEAGYSLTVEETGSNFHENALLKAQFIYNQCNNEYTVISDDSGLEVEALQNMPGVHSARFAGPNSTDFENNIKLLEKLKNIKNRSAKFVCVLCLINKEGVHYFQGVTEGTIAEEIMGNSGFGYDSLFIPKGESKTYAELGQNYKDQVSHRRKAVELLRQYLMNRAL